MEFTPVKKGEKGSYKHCVSVLKFILYSLNDFSRRFWAS